MPIEIRLHPLRPRIPSPPCATLSPPPPTNQGAHLPAEVAVVHVSNVEGLGGKGVRLHVYLGPSDLRDLASGGGDRCSASRCRHNDTTLLTVTVSKGTRPPAKRWGWDALPSAPFHNAWAQNTPTRAQTEDR